MTTAWRPAVEALVAAFEDHERRLVAVEAREDCRPGEPGPDDPSVPPAPTPGPVPAPSGRHPSNVIPALAHWTIMLPTGSAGDPDNEYLVGKSIPGTYYVADGAVVFRCHPGTAVHSKNSKYGRCEAREMRDGKWTKAAWSSTHSRRLTARLRIDASRLAHKIVNCVQIHDGGDDVLQVQLRDGVIGVAHDDGQSWAPLLTDYRGEVIDVSIENTGRGKVIVTAGSKSVELLKAGSGWYFKVGNYPNTGGANAQRRESPDAFCDVVVYRLDVTPHP